MLKFKNLLLLLFLNISFSQTIYKSFESDFLSDSRELKIQLPRNYSENVSKKYPGNIFLNAGAASILRVVSCSIFSNKFTKDTNV